MCYSDTSERDMNRTRNNKKHQEQLKGQMTNDSSQVCPVGSERIQVSPSPSLSSFFLPLLILFLSSSFFPAPHSSRVLFNKHSPSTQTDRRQTLVKSFLGEKNSSLSFFLFLLSIDWWSSLLLFLSCLSSKWLSLILLQLPFFSSLTVLFLLVPVHSSST